MSEHPLFDLAESLEAKERGMIQAANNKKSLLEFARKGARKIARGRLSRECTADDVQQYLVDNNISVHALGSAAGSLFKGKEWIPTDRMVKSTRVHSHGRLIRVWKLV